MNIDVDTLKTTENPRSTMVAILNASTMSIPYKTMGYMYLNSCSDVDIEKIRVMFINVLGYLGDKDMDGLSNYLVACGIKADFVKMVLTYVTANSNKD
jgi:hypothetical protein